MDQIYIVKIIDSIITRILHTSRVIKLVNMKFIYIRNTIKQTVWCDPKHDNSFPIIAIVCYVLFVFRETLNWS